MNFLSKILSTSGPKLFGGEKIWCTLSLFWVLKNKNNDLIGYYEIEKHENKEFELINMGILSEYRSKGFGSLLLKHVLKKSFDNNPGLSVKTPIFDLS